MKTATNLEKAVQAAMSLYPENVGKRLVLLTDGQENEGTIELLESTITSNHIQVCYWPIESKIEQEAYITNLELPAQVGIGENFSVKVEVESNIKTTADLKLYQGSQLKVEEEVNLQTGENTFLFQDVQTEGGLKDYRAVIEPVQDTNTVNNEFVGFTNATAPNKVLVIEGKPGQGAELCKLLDAASYEYECVAPNIVPKDMITLTKYKVIITVDVYAEDLPVEFMGLVKGYVKDYAGGFIATAGTNSFALGEYKDTPLEEILPVDMEIKAKEKQEETAIMLVIDHSGSMSEVNSGVSNLELAKAAAIKAVQTMQKTDSIGVIEFDDTYHIAAELTKGTKKEELEEKIESIAIGGGTSIYPAVKVAFEKLEESKAKHKHVILLTDGQDESRGYATLMRQYREKNITLSAVSIGKEADETLLKQLSTAGAGRYYHSDISTDIPRIFAKEVMMVNNTYLIQKEFTPAIIGSSMMSQIASGGLPSMFGYIATTKKELATVHLTSDTEDPILASWQYGLGKTVAFTSDVQNKWTANYANWDGYVAFWKQIVDSVITDTNLDDDQIGVEQTVDGAKVTYHTKDYSDDTELEVIYTDEKGNNHTAKLEATSPGTFVGELPLEQVGIYSLNVQKKEHGETIKATNYGVAKQYSKEYQYNKVTSSFQDFIRGVNGKKIKKPREIFAEEVPHVESGTDLTKWLLMLASLLFFWDILIRRTSITISEILERCGVKRKVDKVKSLSLSTNQERIFMNKDKQKDLINEEEALDLEKEIHTKRIKPKGRLKQKKQTEEQKQSIRLDTTNLLQRKEERNNKKL